MRPIGFRFGFTPSLNPPNRRDFALFAELSYDSLNLSLFTFTFTHIFPFHPWHI